MQTGTELGVRRAKLSPATGGHKGPTHRRHLGDGVPQTASPLHTTPAHVLDKSALYYGTLILLTKNLSL